MIIPLLDHYFTRKFPYPLELLRLSSRFTYTEEEEETFHRGNFFFFQLETLSKDNREDETILLSA